MSFLMTQKDAFDQAQRVIAEWAERTFPKSTVQSISAHLGEELGELCDALGACVLNGKHGIKDEAADVVMLLMHLAHKQGWSLYDAVVDKFATVQKRKWGKPNKKGVVHHIKRGKR